MPLLGCKKSRQAEQKMEINSFNYFIDEAFKVNYSMLNYTGEANADKQRFFSVNNIKYYSTKGVLFFNSGFSTSKQNFKYANIHSKNRVNQIYASLNFKSDISENIDFQTGVAYDYHQNNFNDTMPQYYFVLEPTAPTQTVKTSIYNPILEAYAYSHWHINKKINLSAGVRSNIPLHHQQHYINTQLALKYKISPKASILLSAGNYHSYATPNYYNKTFALLSAQQIACDYSFLSKNLGIKAAAYYKNEDGQKYLNAYTSVNNIETIGLELYAAYKFLEDFKLTASYLFIDQTLKDNGKTYPGHYDFNYLIKTSLQYSNFKWFTASVSYTGRPGRYYTPIHGVKNIPQFNYAVPNMSAAINSAQYNSYNKIDFTINRYTPIGGGAIIPFLSITNIFDIENQSSVHYNQDYTTAYFDHYGKRVIYFGVIWQLDQ